MSDHQTCAKCGLRIDPWPDLRMEPSPNAEGWFHLGTAAGREAEADHAAVEEDVPMSDLAAIKKQAKALDIALMRSADLRVTLNDLIRRAHPAHSVSAIAEASGVPTARVQQVIEAPEELKR